MPPLAQYGDFALKADGKEMSTTMAFVRMLGGLLKDKQLGPRVVPIVADEARTFGMANLFKQIGIYSCSGQNYEPEDIGSLMSYREATNGQILEEGISEAGALSSWTAAATSYSVHGLPMLPFYIYYSMFGFQRVGDLIWAAADQRARGFLLGATAGRTTLGGEGLQHQDGSSLVQAAQVPNCRAYDPCFAGEFAVILDHGMRADAGRAARRFLLRHADERELRAAFVAGGRGGGRDPRPVPLGRRARRSRSRRAVRLVGSGTILREVIAAAELLRDDWGIASEIWSATSFSELAREAREVERFNRLHPDQAAAQSHVARCLAGDAPVVAATDYVRAWPQPSPAASRRRSPCSAPMASDAATPAPRCAASSRWTATTSCWRRWTALARAGRIERSMCAQAIQRYGIDTEADASWSC